MPYELTASTRHRLNAAAEVVGAEELESTLADALNLVRFADLDNATQIAIDSVTRAIAEGHPEEVVRYCGSGVITGYLVGRAMLRTVGGALYFSNPLTEADHASTMIRLSTTDEAPHIPEAIRPISDLYVQVAIEKANRVGPLSPLSEQLRVGLAGGSAVAGVTLAIVEHDLFVAERPTDEERDPVQVLEDLAGRYQGDLNTAVSMGVEPLQLTPEEMTRWRFVLAVHSTHRALDLGKDFPLQVGVRTLLLIGNYHASGLLESDATLLSLAGGLNDLPRPHRKALGFGLFNMRPTKARAYVRQLLLNGVESKALSIPLGEAKAIADRFDRI